MYVLDSADLKTAVQECVLGALSFNGQRCTALKILFVHRKVVEPFLQAFCERVNALKKAGGCPCRLKSDFLSHAYALSR